MTNLDRFRDNGFRLTSFKEAAIIKRRVKQEQEAAVAKTREDKRGGSMRNVSAESILSLVDLTLIDDEGVHYHWDPVTEFYNQCHDGDGRFCSGPGAGLTGRSSLPDKDGDVGARAPGPVPRGRNGGSLVDPHDGTKTIDGVRGYDKTGKFDKNGKPGKPVPGTDAWLEAHGLDRKTFESRPYVKYEADRGDPALAEAYKDYPQADRFFKRSAEQEGQQGGYIMIKHEVPGSPYGPVPPQIRPNKDLVTDQRVKAQKEAAYNNAVARLEVLKQTTGPVLIRERKERLKQAELNLERIKTATPEKVRQEANDNLAKAHEGVTQAKESGSSVDIVTAKKNLASVQRAHIKEMRRADRWDAEHELYDAETSVTWAKSKLVKAQTDPMAALAAEIKTQESTVKRAKKAADGASAKYVFAPGTTVARIEMHPDPLNVKNLTEGKGRIYFAMEGSIKNDAIFTALKREDPTASVVNVPSVTLWQEKGGNAAEIKWFAGKYGKGREIILIPDADGINNPNVMQQAKAMSAALKTFGAGEVLLATPPLKPGTKYVIDKFDLPSGRGEERKGIDDHLGAGRGTLGQLQFTKNVKYPSYDLSSLAKAEAKATGVKGMNKSAIPNTEKALAAISSIVGPEGTARITKNILAQASGLPATSAKDARDRLSDLGIITVEHIFDEQALSRGKRIFNPKVSPERVAELVKRKIISEPRPDQLYTDANFDEAPVITIRDSRFLIKHTDVSTGTLSELSSWNPPKTYKGWTSPVTKKPDTTGIAARQVEAQAKTSAKVAANKSQTTQAKKDADIQSYLERKVAAPGRRLVRTPEGARRYGVPIGSPIPIFASESGDMFNMSLIEHTGVDTVVQDSDEVGLLSLELVTMGSYPFIEKLHPRDLDGTFIKGPRKWSKLNGNRKLAKSKLADSDYYQMTTLNGEIIKAVDFQGADPQLVQKWMDAVAQMQEIYELKPPRTLVITTRGKGVNASTGFDSPEYININIREMSKANKASEVRGDAKKGWKLYLPGGLTNNSWYMPQAGKASLEEYIITHEYGHSMAFSNHTAGSKTLYRNKKLRQSLSEYGQKNEHEAYAEAFAEWHCSKGKTTNKAAKAYAKYERWVGSESLTAGGSGYTDETPQDAGFEKNLLQAIEGGGRVLDYFDGKTLAEIEGEIPSIEPTETEIARAKVIFDDVESDTTAQATRTEFYNSCHDAEGRFCPTGGGVSGRTQGPTGKGAPEKLTGNSKWQPHTDGKASVEWTGSWPPSSGRPVATIAQKRLGTVTMNGIKAKTVYEVTAANGNKVRLYDKTGKAGPYVSDLLNNHARMNEMYPLTPPRNLIVSKFGVKDGNTFASVHHGDRATYVNANRLGYDVKNLRPGFQMPSSHTGNTKNHDYILTHEYGHHVDFELNVLNGVYTKHPLTYNKDFLKNMSRYGNGQGDNGLMRVGTTDTYRSIESYAEAFGEWHHSNGTTRNPAAIALARWEGWYGTDKDKALAASGSWEPTDVEAWYRPLFETTAQNLVQFGDLFSFAVGEDMDDEGIEFELPVAGKGEIGVADDFEAGESVITGDFESQDSNADQIARANALMQAVLKELEENG